MCSNWLTSIPINDMIVSCDESFCCYGISHLILGVRLHDYPLTALTSARFPHREKCALRLALELPPATPHRARSTPAVLSTMTREAPAGIMGDKQSRIIARSLKTSAASRYILHSGSRAVPTRCAKRIVAIRPEVSCRICSNRAEVGEASALPTPTP